MRMRLLWVGVIASGTAVAACAKPTYRLSVTTSAAALARVTSDRDTEVRPELSPDGTMLLFDSRVGDEASIVGIDPVRGANRTVFTPRASQAAETAWAPDGSFFVYTSNAPGEWSLVRTVSSTPNAAVQIVIAGEIAPLISDPTIAPDGKRVAFTTRIRGIWQVGTANLDGSNLTILGEGFNPDWGPKGDRIAFVRITNRRAHVFTVDAETGTNLVQVTSGETDNIQPSWSPDGERIVFTSNRADRKPPRGVDVDRRNVRGRFNLFTVRAYGTEVVQLTDGDAQNINPHWSASGSIFFASNQAGSFDIWRMRLGR